MAKLLSSNYSRQRMCKFAPFNRHWSLPWVKVGCSSHHVGCASGCRLIFSERGRSRLKVSSALMSGQVSFLPSSLKWAMTGCELNNQAYLSRIAKPMPTAETIFSMLGRDAFGPYTFQSSYRMIRSSSLGAGITLCGRPQSLIRTRLGPDTQMLGPIFKL